MKKKTKEKLKKFFGSLFWLLLNCISLVVCVKFFSEEFCKEVPHNMWLSSIIFIIGVMIIDISTKKLIENLFEKITKPNQFLKRTFVLLTTLMLNIIASTLIIFAIGSAFNIPVDLFFAKILIGVILIFDILKLKRVLEKMRKARPVKHLLPYG